MQIRTGVQDEAHSIKMYRPWVGVLLSFFISGAAQFLSGKKLNGFIWFLVLNLLSLISLFCFASPDVPGSLLGFVLMAVCIVLWIVMLVNSHRSIPRFHWYAWVLFGFLSFGYAQTDKIAKEIFKPFKIPTNSMAPTLRGEIINLNGSVVSGDRVIVEGYSYWFNKPQRGDIVVFRTAGISESQLELYKIPSDEYLVKRVVGLPGDILSIHNGHLYNHEKIISEPPGLAKLQFFISSISLGFSPNPSNSFPVADGNYFVIGDNTTNSLDSRYWGPVQADSIIGKISKIYWPLDRAGSIQ